MNTKSLFALFFASGIACACSSSSSSNTNTGTQTNSDAGATPTFTEIYTNIIEVKCMGCHTSATGSGVTAGKLDMTSQAAAYTDLVNAKAAGSACSGKGTRVTPGAPDSSIMYLKVSLDDASPCGGKMPLGGTPLEQAEVDQIEAWINAGAPNN